MADAIVTFAKKLTVGLKEFGPLNTEEPQIAFMTPNTGDSAYDKRLTSLKSWCRGWKGEFIETLHFIDNEPVTGFQIQNVMSRYSTDNKVFRLKDPRGFIVEIYTGNLEMILQTSNILKGGYIEDACVWGRQGSNNVLVPISSELYQKSVSFAEEKKPIKDLKPGDIVKDKSGREEIYLGPVSYAGINTKTTYSSTDYWHRNRIETKTPVKVTKAYAFMYKTAYNSNYSNIRIVKSSKTEFVVTGNDDSVLSDKYFENKPASQYISAGSYNDDVKVVFDSSHKIAEVTLENDTLTVVTDKETLTL